jgi:CheY-like chemotaxis protein
MPEMTTHTKRVLIVDDEAIVGNALKRLLAPHDVTAVTSVDEALALIHAGSSFDVIFSDLMMPTKTGIDFFHALAALRPGEEKRIVFITGDPFTSRHFLASVPNSWLQKPLLPGQLHALVDAA